VTNVITIQFPEEMAENSIPPEILSKDSKDKIAGFFSDPYFENFFFEKEMEVKEILQKNGHPEYNISLIRIAKITNIRLFDGGFMDVTFILNVKNDTFNDFVEISSTRFKYTSYMYNQNLNMKGSNLYTSIRYDVTEFQKNTQEPFMTRLRKLFKR
jgi:hypothetical protein